ncbi:hypothetical protein ACHQM5_019081 [Ranunculus cassubicifolius]
MLLEWLQQNLSPSLYYLQIRGCEPKLQRRYEMDKGEDWHKISHLQLNIMERIDIYNRCNSAASSWVNFRMLS